MSSFEQTKTMQYLPLDDQDAYTGIGWFWDDKLLGVVKVKKDEAAENRFGIQTCNKLHKNLWYKLLKENPELKNLFTDYSLCPRFRIFYYRNEVPHWRVMCGAEIAESEDAKSLIMEEFNLYDTDAEFLQDAHWELGHGWSKEYLDGLA